MIKKILVPIDFSDLSYKALDVASKMCDIFEAKITLFHAYIPVADVDGLYYMGMGLGAQSSFTELEPSIKSRLLNKAKEYIPEKHIADAIVGVGNPAHAIVEEARYYDFLIMSTHGRTGFSRFLLGSTAEKILRLTHTPTIIVEEHSLFYPLQKILLTTDLSDNSYAAFPYAKFFAKSSNAKLDVVHIIKYDDYDNMEEAQKIIDDKKERMDKLTEKYFSEIKEHVRNEVVLTSESPHEAIFNLNFSRNYNLIIMATIGRTGLKYLTLGSTTANVVRTVETAVLSINPKKQGD